MDIRSGVMQKHSYELDLEAVRATWSAIQACLSNGGALMSARPSSYADNVGFSSKMLKFPNNSTSPNYTYIDKRKKETKNSEGAACIAEKSNTEENHATRMAWEKVAHVLQQHYHEPDLDAARLLYASAVAHRLQGQPAWLMLIAPPGSMKTELLNSLETLPKVHSVDRLTPKSFLSGQFGNRAGDAAPSLLHRIGSSGIILAPDFSTLLKGRSEEIGAVFADLRRIFDGRLAKEFGIREGSVSWKGRITCFAACTPQLERFKNYENELGDRFLQVRLARPDVAAAMKAMKQTPSTGEDGRAACSCGVVSDTAWKNYASRSPRRSCGRFLSLPSSWWSVGITSAVIQRTKQILDPQGDDAVESPTRVSQQLGQLAKGLAALRGDTRVNAEDVTRLIRLVFDGLPHTRASVLRDLVRGKRVIRSRSVVSYAMEDLEHLGVLRSRGFSSKYRNVTMWMKQVWG